MHWHRGDRDLEGLVRAWKTFGANTLVMFLQHCFVTYPQIEPYIFPIEKVRPLAAWLNARGLRGQFVALTDTQERDPDGTPAFNQSTEWCIDRVRAIRDALASTPNCLTVMNEPEMNGGVDRLRRIVDALGLREKANRPLLMASGLYPSTGNERREDVLPLDFCGDHPPRKREWPSETGKTSMYQYQQLGIPIIQDEPMGCAEIETGDRDPNPENWEDAGAGMALSGAGGTFHGEAGINCELPKEREAECARRFFRAMNLLPTECPTWTWAHDDYGEHPLAPVRDGSIAGEIVARVKGNVAYAAAQQPTTRWQPEGHRGWRIAQVLNPRGTILRLEK
jgi:hypothetical protein